MFLSIIIPVYNASDTIERCLESIWRENLPQDDYEVICVDDCSTDSSISVLNEISMSHSQLRILKNPENLRAGGARNHGVREANGEYILFIDADDYFHKNSLKEAFDYQKVNRLDILMCDFARHIQTKVNNDLVHKFPYKNIMSGREFLVKNSLPYAPWKYIFKRSLMLNNKVYFAEKVSCEDVDWSHKIALFASSMQYKPILLTHYILSNTSQTGSEYKNSQTVFSRLIAGKRVSELLTLCNTDDEKERIRAVAQETLMNGVIFLNALLMSPQKKATILRACIDPNISWRNELRIVSKHPYLYSVMSTIISPLFKMAIFTKRNLIGR